MRVGRRFRSLGSLGLPVTPPSTPRPLHRMVRQASVPPSRLLASVSDRFQVEVMDHVFLYEVHKQTDANRERLLFFTDGMRIYNPTKKYAMVDLEGLVDSVTGFFLDQLMFAFDAEAEHLGIPPDQQYFRQVLVKPRGDFRNSSLLKIDGFVVFVESAYGHGVQREVAIGEMNRFFQKSIAPKIRRP